jgi:hypothetical protein
MENGPFIDGLPIKNGDFPWDISSCMVSTWQFFVDPSPFLIGPASTHVCAKKGTEVWSWSDLPDGGSPWRFFYPC